MIDHPTLANLLAWMLEMLQTNARRTYMEALLAFADEPAPFAVASFARRRHLIRRKGLPSREAVMPSRRVVVFSLAVSVVVAAGSVYATSRFPLTATTSITLAPPTAPQAPPRDSRTGARKPAASREAVLKAALASDPGTTGAYLELAQLQEDRGAIAEAEATFNAARAALPNNTVILRALARFYNRQGDFEQTMQALEEVAAVDPSDPARHQTIAVYYLEKANKDHRITPADKLVYIQKGIAAADRALALDTKYVDAMTYKTLLLRLLGNEQTDPGKRAQLYAEANALRERALETRRANPAAGPAPPPPPPPPPPPRGGGAEQTAAGDEAPVRVGNQIPPPKKIKDVLPAYPPAAREATVSGVVIVEALIGPSGKVQNARVLRSIPLLDQAALDAVRQWEFEPTLLNGRAIPIIMTLTVTFSPQ